jgi:uncharacterized protein (TIGR02246 family)
MIAQSPQEWWPLFQQAMRAGDAEALLRLYEPEAVIADAGGQMRSGHTGIREQLRPLVEAKANFDFTIKKIIQAGSLALLHTEVRITGPRVSSGYALEVLRRQPDGRWLLVLGDPFTIGAALGEAVQAMLVHR